MRTRGITRARHRTESELRSLIRSAWQSMPRPTSPRYHQQKISIKDNLCLIPRQVTEMMLFSKEPESQTAAEGEDVIFECEAGGFPAPKVSRLLSLSDWLQTQIDLKIKLDHN